MCEIKDVQAIYSFMKIRGIGVTRTNKELLSYTQQLGSMWKLEDWLLSVLTAEQKAEYYSQYEMVEGLKIKSLEVFFNTVLDQSYPSMLKSLLKLNTPPVLSMIGNSKLLTNRKVGFSGSRKVSEKGVDVTRDCVEQLSVSRDVSIVSGYAQDRVLVVSEYLPKDKWSVSRAMNRNNTIIGLSDAMVVVEAGLTGGSLDAGLRSLEDKKPLFVPVYSDYPESALGNRILLERGAAGIKRNRQSNRANVMALL